MTWKRMLMAVALCLAMAGCSTTVGRQIDKTSVSAIKKGVTTKSEVLAAFGEPAYKSFNGGKEIWQYTYSKASEGLSPSEALVAVATAGVYIPRHGESSTQVLLVTFKGDVVDDVSYQESSSTSTQR